MVEMNLFAWQEQTHRREWTCGHGAGEGEGDELREGHCCIGDELREEHCCIHTLLLCCEVMSDSCSHLDCNPPGSSVDGISQTRILEWVVISFFRRSS